MNRVGKYYLKMLYVLVSSCFIWVGLNYASTSFTHGISRSVDVEFTVPATSVLIQGYAAPNGLVTVRLSTTVIGTTVAQSNGYYSFSTTQNSGLRTYSVGYEDVFGRTSALTTRTVSVQPQQINSFDFFLSPTIQRTSSNPLQIGSVIQLRGYTVPGASVKILVDNGTRSYAVSAASDGSYEILISTEDLGVGTFQINAQATIESSLSTLSNSLSVTVERYQVGPSAPDIVVRPDLLPPPVFLSPQDNTIIEGNSVVVRGESVPDAQIVIYQNGVAIGSVFADRNGYWEFLYTASITPVVLSFEACVNGRCSVLSQTLTLNFNLVAQPCNIDIRLVSYRFWGLKTNESIILESAVQLPSMVIVEIDWGDGQVEKFTTGNSERTYSYSYRSTGIFNGTIRAMQDGCEVERFFSVHVVDQSKHNNMYIFLLVLLLIVFGVVRFMREIMIKKNKNT